MIKAIPNLMKLPDVLLVEVLFVVFPVLLVIELLFVLLGVVLLFTGVDGLLPVVKENT